MVISQNLNWFPTVLISLVNGGEGMGLVWFWEAVVHPLLDGLVFIPGVVPGENFYSRHLRLVEDFVLFVKEGDCLLGGEVFVNARFGLVEEGLLLYHVVVLFNHVGMSGWEALY